MKIWLDDLRPAPEGWEWVKLAEDAVEILGEGNVEDISLDHDLGDDYDPDYQIYNTGYDVAKWIEQRTAHDPNYFPPRIYVHSDNPVGRANIWGAILSIHRILTERWGNRIMTARWEDWIKPR